MTIDPNLAELVREVRARAGLGDERTIALYGRPLPALAAHSTTELIGRIRELQGETYLVDARQDLFDVKDASVLDAAAAVGMLVESSNLTESPTGWTLTTKRFGEEFHLCKGERFEDQPCAGFCSGVLVGHKTLATAAHCLSELRPDRAEERLAKIRVVFGFRMADGSRAVTELPSNGVYKPVRVIAIDRTADWLLLELDREVTGVTPRSLRSEGKIADGAAVSIVGHPCGLPAKYAPGAKVRANDNPLSFRADLDAFGGNSGSPIFAADSTIEGLLVRGAPDFVHDTDGMRSLVIPVRDDTDDPPGEDCVRATLFAPHVRVRT